MIFGSVCSGIEAASVAWHPLGWKAAWLAEIEPFPSAVLNHHYPDVPNLGDMTKLAGMVANDDIEAPDVLVGGTPCQAFSVAGARKGLSDDRGFLTIKFVELADEIDKKRAANGFEPAVIVWENVPGVLNSKDNAFGAFLGLLAGEDCELQPSGGKWSTAGCVLRGKRAVAWRVLDAQYFGVAQRRRRVFVVASARAGFDPTAILFESDGVRRDSAPSRTTESTVEPAAYRGTASGSETFGCLMAGARKYHNQSHQESFSGDYHIIDNGRIRNPTLAEISRFQGFPPEYFQPFEKQYWHCAGALGNSMAVPCMNWIGKRIASYSARPK